MKKGARVTITYNIDTTDGIVNGSLGTIADFVKKGESIHQILVLFDDITTGEKTREHANLDKVVPISLVSFQYSVGRSQHNTVNPKVIQFPIKLAWASTVHRFQGQTVMYPKAVVGHMERIKQPAQAYVLFDVFRD